MEQQKEDTKNLLKECNAGSKMAVDSLDQVLPMAQSESLKELLETNKQKHTVLGEKIHEELRKNGQREEDPPMMAKTMAHITTSVKMAWNPSDQEIASIITDGCNMGIKSLHGYLNEYSEASPQSRHLTEELAQLECSLMEQLQPYL